MFLSSFVLLFYNGFCSLLVEINYFAMVFFGFEWLSLVLLRFSLVCQWLPLVLSARRYVFLLWVSLVLDWFLPVLWGIWPGVIALGLSFLTISHPTRNKEIWSSLTPLLRVISRSGPLWSPLGFSFLYFSPYA